jgi:gag-polypeptide of LTR copia-type
VAKVEAYEYLIDDWYEKQFAIRSVILGTLPEKTQVRLGSAESNVTELWKELLQIFEDQNVGIQAHLLSQLHRIRTPEDGDLMKVLRQSNDYTAAGGTLTELDIATVLINAVPTQYHPVIQTSSSLSKAPSFDSNSTS